MKRYCQLMLLLLTAGCMQKPTYMNADTTVMMVPTGAMIGQHIIPWERPIASGLIEYQGLAKLKISAQKPTGPEAGKHLFMAHVSLPEEDDANNRADGADTPMKDVTLWCRENAVTNLLDLGITGMKDSMQCFLDIDQNGSLDLMASRPMNGNELFPRSAGRLIAVQPVRDMAVIPVPTKNVQFPIQLIAKAPKSDTPDLLELVIAIKQGDAWLELNHKRRFFNVDQLPLDFDMDGIKGRLLAHTPNGVEIELMSGFQKGAYQPFLLGIDRFRLFVDPNSLER